MFESAAALRRMAGPILLGVCLLLAACTVTPLYAPGPGGETLRAELAAISILPVDNRVGQIIRNELRFAFTGGSAPTAERYELSISASPGGGGFNVTAPGNEPTDGVSVTATFVLVDILTQERVTRGTVRAETRYTRSNQAFANVRAEEGAQELAALEAAEQILRLISIALGVAG